MEEQNTVDLELDEGTELPEVDLADDAQESITMAELLTGAEGGGVPGETVVNEAVGAPDGNEQAEALAGQAAKASLTQQDFDAAISKRLTAERAKYAPAAELAELVMQATGAKDMAEAQKLTREALAERRAAELGTTTAQEIARMEDRERIARLERGSVQPAAAEAPDAATETWARDTLEKAHMVARVTGDEGFVREVMTPGSAINRRILGGEDVEAVWRAERRDKTAASAYTQQPKPASMQVERGTGGNAKAEPTRLTDADIDRIDEQLKRGIHVRMQ